LKGFDYAPTNSPTLTGNPKSVTPNLSDDDTSIATTAFVKGQGYITSSALTGYATESFVTSQGYITSSALTGYALLSGATFTGKVNFTTVSGVAGLNVGVGGTDVGSNTPGDLWIAPSGSGLNYRDGLGAWRILAARNLSNTFTAPQIVSTPAGTTNAALRITQLGTGNALVVEDSTSPDATAFIVDQHGKVGIGVAPDATAALKVDGNGIMFGDGTVQNTAGFIPGSGNLLIGGYSLNSTQGSETSGSTYLSTSVSPNGFATSSSVYESDSFGNPYVALSKSTSVSEDTVSGSYNNYNDSIFGSFSLNAISGLNFGSGTLSVTSTGITFPDLTVQTTAAVAGITDAPSDGNYYVRKDGAWVQCTVVSIYDSNSSTSYNCLTV
jgi:hypothetical protein